MKLFFTCLFMITLSSCVDIAVWSTPPKRAETSHTALAMHAEKYFWQTLHQGRYNNIPETDRLLTAAYLENPNDPALAAHLGFLHIWAITERYRLKTISPLIVNEIILAKKYFADAVQLNPDDARFLGFYGDSQLAEGKIFHDEREEVRGYFTLKKAIHAWPEFNYFTAGYIMSILPNDSKHFKEGLAWQWQTLDLCTGTHVDRKNPDFKPYLALETTQGAKRACWNSVIAPFNFEGFFLNMGDMLVKSGDVKTAVIIYHNAMLAKNYSQWPYKHLLEAHLRNAQLNTVNFQKEFVSAEKTVLFNSGYGCVACHQN
ncbi:hypothetical protein AYO45_04835 [Gammaproteobacteria bacterium SCGC AG-212-F23]|nr:hypothetical protein AYO45_04835 [Gammaproteobacteria bacterium SCGC AG-212-F23]